MKDRFSPRPVGVCLAILAVGLLAGGCDWGQFGYNTSHNGDNDFDTTITPANVSNLTAEFSATDGTTGATTAQAVVNGVLYASDANGVEAYSSTGTTGCSGSVCSPLWTYATGALGTGFELANTNLAIANKYVYVSTPSALEAFDTTGQQNCSGAPKVCQPLWSASGSFGSPTVTGTTVFVTAATEMEAFSATGQTNCSGTPTVCAPLWTYSPAQTGLSGIQGNAVTISGNTAFVEVWSSSSSFVAALDANGVTKCSGTPTTCAPLRLYVLNYAPGTVGYPMVLGSTLYVATGGVVQHGSANGDIEAFDATGVDNCSSECHPIATANFAFAGGPLVTGEGAVFASLSNFNVFPFYAFSTSGLGQLWTSSVQANPVAVGGSVLYADGYSGGSYVVYAFDASGNAGCGGSPETCSPLWSAPGSNPIVADGRVDAGTANSSGDGEVVIYGLPGG